MTTATTTLTDFLLARIAEDEGQAEHVLVEVAPYEVEAMERRVLAECAAKRNIVRRARRERGRFEQTGGNLGNPIEAVVAYETALRHLAAIYSDHADYDPSWAVS